MRLQDFNLQVLKDALMKMPNVKTIEVSTECALGHGTLIREAFKDGLAAPYGDLESSSFNSKRKHQRGLVLPAITPLLDQSTCYYQAWTPFILMLGF